jgi:protein gp37
MTTIGTAISWTNSTWNPWRGCIAVSAGCDHCYARTLVEQRWGQRFDQVLVQLDQRLRDIRKFRPLVDKGGLLPHLVFVNSLSDFFFEQVEDRDIHRTLDALEQHKHVGWQILTKRPIRARKLLVARYGNSGIPPHIWIGVSAEDNRVARRLDIMRSIRDRTGGGGTFFVSVEPIVGPTDQLNFDGMDWVITGGESGAGARVMERSWLTAAIERAFRDGCAVWHKQNGTIASHPNLDRVPPGLKRPTDRLRWLAENGWELLPGEKGGATLDQRTFREFPRAYHEQKEAMNA